MEMYYVFNRSIATIPSIYIMDFTTILGIWSLVLLSGHGAISIAGFNTMTEDEKKTIDEKKLCFVGGIGGLISALVLFFMALVGPKNITNTTAIIAGSIIAIDAVVMVYIANTKCKK